MEKHKVYVRLTYASIVAAESMEEARHTVLTDGINVGSFVHGDKYDYSYVGMDIEQVKDLKG